MFNLHARLTIIGYIYVRIHDPYSNRNEFSSEVSKLAALEFIPKAFNFSGPEGILQASNINSYYSKDATEPWWRQGFARMAAAR